MSIETEGPASKMDRVLDENEQLKAALASLRGERDKLTKELKRAEARDSGGYAPDGKTWKEALFEEAEKRGNAEAESASLRERLEPLENMLLLCGELDGKRNAETSAEYLRRLIDEVIEAGRLRERVRVLEGQLREAVVEQFFNQLDEAKDPTPLQERMQSGDA